MLHYRVSSGLPLLAALLAAACGNNTGLPAASFPNIEDTVSLFALEGTPLSAPSGYVVQTKETVRTDQRGDFDFLFNITPAGQAVFVPAGGVGLARGSGIQLQSVAFDAITTAPTTAYADSAPVPVDSGSVLVVHSRPISCVVGIVFYYGKIEVLAIDTIARRVDFRVLVNQNCGYRDLEIGIPKR